MSEMKMIAKISLTLFSILMSAASMSHQFVIQSSSHRDSTTLDQCIHEYGNHKEHDVRDDFDQRDCLTCMNKAACRIEKRINVLKSLLKEIDTRLSELEPGAFDEFCDVKLLLKEQSTEIKRLKKLKHSIEVEVERLIRILERLHRNEDLQLSAPECKQEHETYKELQGGIVPPKCSYRHINTHSDRLDSILYW